MLLERKDINSDHAHTKSGLTPLSWAAANENQDVAKMLL